MLKKRGRLGAFRDAIAVDVESGQPHICKFAADMIE